LVCTRRRRIAGKLNDSLEVSEWKLARRTFSDGIVVLGREKLLAVSRQPNHKQSCNRKQSGKRLRTFIHEPHLSVWVGRIVLSPQWSNFLLSFSGTAIFLAFEQNTGTLQTLDNQIAAPREMRL
jgi:hypothetical protein